MFISERNVRKHDFILFPIYDIYIYMCFNMFQQTNFRAEPAQYLELRHIVHVNLVLLECVQICSESALMNICGVSGRLTLPNWPAVFQIHNGTLW